MRTIVVAAIAAFPPTLAAILAFLASRSVRRSVTTSADIPIGALVERIERRVESLDTDLKNVAQRVARMEGLHAP